MADIPAEEPAQAPAQSLFSAVPVEVTVCVGKARPLIGDLLRLEPDSVLPLDRRIEEPVELLVGGRVIARGELEETDGRLSVRLTEVADLPSGLE